MINKIFLLKIKLKKKVINNNINSLEIKENSYIINKEKKLVKSYYFNY